MKNTKSALCMFLASAGMALVLGGCNNDAADFSGTEGENFIAENVSETELLRQENNVFETTEPETDSNEAEAVDQIADDLPAENPVKTQSLDIQKKSVTPTPTPMPSPEPTEEPEPEINEDESDDNRGCIGNEGLVW